MKVSEHQDSISRMLVRPLSSRKQVEIAQYVTPNCQLPSFLHTALLSLYKHIYGLVWTYLHVCHAHHPAAVVHVLFEVHFNVLKDEGEGARGVDDVVQHHNVSMLEVLQEGDLPDGSAGRTLFVF